MPRGRGEKKNYNLDYSRFSQLDDDSDDEAPSKPAAGGGKAVHGVSDAMRGMMPENMPLPDDAEFPQELRDAMNMMRYSKITGDEGARRKATELAMKAVEDGGPEIRARFEEVTRTMLEKEGITAEPTSGLPGEWRDTAAARTEPRGVDEVAGELGGLKDKMMQQLEATQKQMEMLQQQQSQLEGLQSPEDFFRFMADRGFKPEDVQRALTDEEYGRELMERQFAKDAKDAQVVSDDVMKQVEALGADLKGVLSEKEDLTKEKEPAAAKASSSSSSLRLKEGQGKEEKKRGQGGQPQSAVPEEDSSGLLPAAAGGASCEVPEHQLQILKDEEGTGKVAEIVLTVQLPGVASMAAVELDVSARHLRLQTTQDPRYMLSLGPLVAEVAPDEARAKFSKKKQELVLRLTAAASETA